MYAYHTHTPIKSGHLHCWIRPSVKNVGDSEDLGSKSGQGHTQDRPQNAWEKDSSAEAWTSSVRHPWAGFFFLTLSFCGTLGKLCSFPVSSSCGKAGLQSYTEMQRRSNKRWVAGERKMWVIISITRFYSHAHTHTHTPLPTPDLSCRTVVWMWRGGRQKGR